MTSHVKFCIVALLFISAVTLQALAETSSAIKMTLHKCEDLDNERLDEIKRNPIPNKKGLNRQQAKENNFKNSLATTNDATCQDVISIKATGCDTGSSSSLCKVRLFSDITLDMSFKPKFSEENIDKIRMKSCLALNSSDSCDDTKTQVCDRNNKNCVFQQGKVLDLSLLYKAEAALKIEQLCEKELNLKVVVWKLNKNENTPETRKGCCRVVKIMPVDPEKRHCDKYRNNKNKKTAGRH